VTDVGLALGANLGDRVANLQDALDRLAGEGVEVTRVSSTWETAPVPADQPPFLNIVALAQTALAPLDLLAAAKRIETALGRRPGRRWGPRPIDIDILFYGEEAIDLPELTVPHPRIAERTFVLAPLAELVPGPLPHLGATAGDLLGKLEPTGFTNLGQLVAVPRSGTRSANS
jgi:2-amino-4-hydroxy-6-hydroxymethyldihydropteridine diphosphokinase